MLKYLLILMLILVLMAGCSPEPVLSPIPATATLTPSPLPATATQVPFSTPLPGRPGFPLDTLGKTIPWLPLHETARPGVNFVAFNTVRPPFNGALVRSAFAYAVDRRTITEMAQKYNASNPTAATTFTPSGTLERDLYNEAGTGFDLRRLKNC